MKSMLERERQILVGSFVMLRYVCPPISASEVPIGPSGIARLLPKEVDGVTQRRCVAPVASLGGCGRSCSVF